MTDLNNNTLKEAADQIAANIATIISKVQNSKQANLILQAVIVELANSLQIAFAGSTIQDFRNSDSLGNINSNNKYHISPFINISISGIGPVCYINQKDNKIYTLLQRRKKDNYQWWFPGGYVDLIPAGTDILLKERKEKRIINLPSFEQIKAATINKYYQNIINYNCWQKTKKEINDPTYLNSCFKEHNIKWPKNIDSNWQSAWQREVKEESGIDISKYKKAIILNFKCNSTFMIGAEKDRLTNIDGKFCAFLGKLKSHPKTTPDPKEIEQVKWIKIEDILYDNKKQKYIADNKQVNLYTMSLIEEAVFEILCYQIKQISKINNIYNKQQISRFNNPQNMQSYIIEKAANIKIDDLINLGQFLSWQFGDLEIGKNICGKTGNKLYNSSLLIGNYLKTNHLNSLNDFKALEKLLNS